MLIENKYVLGLIVLLFAIIGYQFFKLHCKRRQDIIKLSIRRDSLPSPATGTTWIEGGSCFMKDGKFGRVDGSDCVAIEVM